MVRGRSSRAAKGLKMVSEPIAEATQESTVIHTPDEDEDELAGDPVSAHASPIKVSSAGSEQIVEDSMLEDEDIVVGDATLSAHLDKEMN